MVKVTILDLRIKKTPDTDAFWVGEYTRKSSFTIVEEASGKVAMKWGLLKSYLKDQNL